MGRKGRMMVTQVTIKKYAELSGYTEKAIRGKIDTGVWVQGIHYYKSPDKHIIINIQEVEKWQRNERPQV